MSENNVDRLTRIFEEHRDDNDAASMKKYMRDQFEFMGIKTPNRRDLTKKLIKEMGVLPSILLLKAL